jgi:hypothetical protein
VTDGGESRKAELLHDREHVARHRAFRVRPVIGVRRWTTAVPVSAKVRADNCEVASEFWSYPMPHQMRLWEAVQQQNRRPRSAPAYEYARLVCLNLAAGEIVKHTVVVSSLISVLVRATPRSCIGRAAASTIRFLVASPLGVSLRAPGGRVVFMHPKWRILDLTIHFVTSILESLIQFQQCYHNMDAIKDLAGSTALVTGATSGIGKATVLAFARRGARILVSARDRLRGQAVVAAIFGRSME